MRNIRALLRLTGFILSTLIIYSLIMVGALFSIIGFNYQWLRGYMLKAWGKISCAILGIKVITEGEAPNPPFFLVSNHLSYIDVFVLFSQTRALFIAKNDVKSWPFIGFIIKSCGILFINRERKRDINRVNHLIRRNITENQGVIMFPESTTSDGKSVLPFRSSLLEYPASVELPVHYAVIRYSTSDSEFNTSNDICWWTETPFFIHFFNLLKVNDVKAYVTFGERRIVQNDRKELAKKLEEQIRSDFIPVTEPNTYA